MKLSKQLIAAIVIGIIALILASWWLSTKPQTPQQTDYPIKRTIRYGFTVQNTTNQLQKDVKFWVYGPARQTSTQYAGKIEASLPYQLEIDEVGNQLLQFSFESIPPFATRVVTITAELYLSDKSLALPEQNLDMYLAAEKFIELNNESLAKLAANLQVENKTATTKKIYTWVKSNIKYAGYVSDDRGAAYALKSRKGDCTEYMYLNTALTRLSGIPARGIGGYVYTEDAVLKAKDFHNWSEVYLDGAWHTIDPQNGVYMQNQSHFIAMRLLSQNVDNKVPLKNSHQFAVSKPGIEVKMN